MPINNKSLSENFPSLLPWAVYTGNHIDTTLTGINSLVNVSIINNAKNVTKVSLEVE